MIAIERIAATTEVKILARGGQHIIGFIIEASQRDGRAIFVSFCGMIEDHIENDFDSMSMQLASGEKLEPIFRCQHF
jgi:hypothetical protein